MYSTDERTLTSEVPATIVPYGDQVTIPEGTRVQITHRLGGNFTVTWEGGMAQINGKYAEALGEEAPAHASQSGSDDNHEGPPDEETLWEALRTVFDPEIPVNIVDLGLVYTLESKKDEEADAYDVQMSMTLTAPGCGMGPAIAQDAKYKLEGVPGVREANVDIVWDPPWNQDMISEVGKMELGLL
ncbi:MAG: FeS assembly SUF system protein SufT [Puniceicoccaceae bacterium 5H]|nr:MAG: FeS assembly SUF system protein SufT [Puniceicoccaceae bacterium 5H]